MNLVLFIILAGYAVKCEDSNYYVIQMPYDDPPFKKPFNVYWNVPTMQCASKKIPFQNLYEKFGIIQNKNDSFRGEKVAILYDPGVFPALLKNDSSGKYTFRNGGVPQEGDLNKHKTSFRNVLEQSIPDPDFNGVGIIDFESWRPVFRQNFGVLTPYKDVSYQIERKNHYFWPTSWVQEEAKQRFESKARAFMQTTISIAKQMRPHALWGYYGFPYCFNMASNNMAARCADKVPAENDQIYWLWAESSALYPSLYSSRELSTWQLSQLVAGRAREAARVTRGGPILPYFWFRYRDGGFMTEEDLQAVLKTLYKSQASGLIIWGASADVNTAEKCTNLLNYVEKVLGPAIAKYAKNNKIHHEISNDIDEGFNNTIILTNYTSTTTMNPITNESNDNITSKPIDKQEEVKTTKAPLRNIEPDLADPEFEWIPPANYTEDIVNYVNDEFKKKTDNVTSQRDKTKTVLRLNDSVLIDLILNTLIDYVDESNSDISEDGSDKELLIPTSTVNYEITTDTTESYNNIDIDTDIGIDKTEMNDYSTEIYNIVDESTTNAYETTDLTKLTSTTDSYDKTSTDDYNTESLFNLEDEFIMAADAKDIIELTSTQISYHFLNNDTIKDIETDVTTEYVLDYKTKVEDLEITTEEPNVKRIDRSSNGNESARLDSETTTISTEQVVVNVV